jgi:Protein of unknown function (DUF2889)
MTIEGVYPDLPDPAGHSPLRRANSVRRTSAIDMTWPEGRGKTMHFHGVARDIFTREANSNPELICLDEMTADIDTDRTIAAIKALPARGTIGKLVGVRGGGKLRQALNEVLPDEQRRGSPLYLLVDDISGTSLIAGWAWSRWPDYDYRTEEDMRRVEQMRAKMEGICIGFRPGSSALSTEVGSSRHHRASPVVPLQHPEDPDGWHDLTVHSEVSMRRARRIDVWVDGDIQVEAAFQDSASAPEGGRIAVHEYSLQVSADPHSLVINSIKARPHVLPYPECPAAIGNVSRIQGKPLAQLRALVLEELPRVHGCTHLNDAMRSMAEVPALLEALRRRV